MTTTEYLQREIRRTELSIRRAERKPNTPPKELRGLHEKLEHLQEALEAVEEHGRRVHEERGGTQGNPLTLEQLRGMDGKPAYWPDDESWGIISVDDAGRWAGIPFFRGRKNGVNFEYDIESRGMEVYAYPPAHIDREKWVECARCRSKNREPLGYDGANDAVSIVIGDNAAAIEADSFGFIVRYCPKCGRPLTEEAWAELERRFFGG